MRRLLLLLVLVSANVRAQEALPLDAEVPPEVSGLPLRSGGTLSWGVADGAPAGGRYRTSLGAGPWLLGVAGESRPGERAAQPRLAFGRTRGRWRLLLGGVDGVWGDGWLLGSRRRSGLGRPRLPGPAPLPLRLSTARSPLGRGALLAWTGGGLQGGLAVLREDDGPQRAALGLRWRGASLDLLAGPSTGALALGLRRGGAAGGAQVDLALLAPATGGRRRGLGWRLALPLGDGVDLAAEGRLLDGPRPAAQPGWLGADPGEELHAALGLAAREGWVWRLGRRHRRGLGLAEDLRRDETALHLDGELSAGQLRLALRQVEEQVAVELIAPPGFPRRADERRVSQELSAALATSSRWRMSWRRRLSATGGGSLLQFAGPLPPWPALRLQLSRVDLEPGAPSFLLFDADALSRSVEALSAGGWRLGARLGLGPPGRRLVTSANLSRQDAGDTRWSARCELDLARR